ncbi:MAG: peptide chain release factor 1 [Jaaginema sp. PMC 1079.18]|nr:peptide chain release factor 1 [Jaaginema sp. PMC 1080.18]MEC4852305.1 peptide chain release factor 1 [Jaaginema sp. PMC 1079.18]MEC4866608.1 peptide chain release factor 1 [Jaaginema sp. PMC 1078.18]
MNDPLSAFKRQPWLPLFQAAGATIAIAILVELILALALQNSAAVRQVWLILFSGVLAVILPILAAAGLGALGVYFCQTWRKEQVYLDTGSLWALILCLMVCLWLKSLLVDSVLVGLSYNSLIGVLLGVFWQGRSYWRGWR